MRASNHRQKQRKWSSRAGVSSVDYVLILGVILPMVAFLMWIGPQIMNLAYEMLGMLVAWPFM
jgi:hypothetical protein